jgi:hypothetical protein
MAAADVGVGYDDRGHVECGGENSKKLDIVIGFKGSRVLLLTYRLCALERRRDKIMMRARKLARGRF